jgi:hypothetical protein
LAIGYIIINMKNLKLIISITFILLLIVSLISCVTGKKKPEDIIYGIDSLVSEIASRTVTLIGSDKEVTIAVYYFTVDGNESNISDYLITGLTTEIANLAGDGITMVSRQGLDRVMSEYSFMVSDLVSEETQVNIGELLGADVILIGFINPLENYDKINIQVLEVETGAVLGGFFLNYVLEDGFERDSSNEIINISNGTVQITGASTITSIIENFDQEILNVNSSHYEEYWGDRIMGASGTTGSEDGYGFLEFSAEFDNFDMLNEWQDSDLTFYLNYKTDWIPNEQDGISVSIYPEGFSELVLIVQQNIGEDIKTFMVNISSNPDEWTKLLIPFNSFKDISALGKLDLDKPVSIGFGIPFEDNYSNYYFRNDLNLISRLLVDELGFFKFKEPDVNGLIEAYEDEILRAPGIFRLGGTDLYVDYSNSDEGELKRNDGVDWQYLKTSIEEDGPSGNYLNLYGEIEINEKIRAYLDDEQSIYVVYRLSTGIDWRRFNNFSMLIRSDVFEHSYFEVASNGTDQYYSSDFSFNSSWTNVRIPFSDLYSDMGSLAEVPLETDEVWISLIFSVSEKSVIEALNSGTFEFGIDIDQLILKE